MNVYTKVVIDTHVVFEGLTKKGGAAGLLIDAWAAEILDIYVSSTLAYEYADVLSRKLSAARWQRLKPVLGALLARAKFVPIYFSWRPASPDPGDDHVIDCAMNAGAVVITYNVRDFRQAEAALGLVVTRPLEAIFGLTKKGE
ncbi:MAG: PIN domain-containing protein [Anaerolineae bacterium]|nr:PIN domain-containing protein [Anaerolineae bacterium]